jgi:hypothetical protein
MDESQVLQNYVFRHDFRNVVFWYRAINKRYASLECRLPPLFYYYFFFELTNLAPKFSYTLLKLTLPPAYGYQHAFLYIQYSAQLQQAYSATLPTVYTLFPT